MNGYKKTEPWYATEHILRHYLLKAQPYLTGQLLDAGCGAKRYKSMFNFTKYVGVELNQKFLPNVVGDLRCLPFKGNEFDSILNNQVLEHINDTHKVFSEFSRVLKKGGVLCITIPFIARIHETPHDYWRISEFGIKYLFQRYGFEEIEICNMGGFLTTQVYLWQFWLWERLSTNRFFRLMRKPVIWTSNHLFIFIHRFDKDRTTPFNYIAIGRKI